MNNELERMWKKTVVGQFEVLSGKNTKITVRIAMPRPRFDESPPECRSEA
jgi:hypothetical protein